MNQMTSVAGVPRWFWLGFVVVSMTMHGCALPTLMKSQLKQKVSQDHFTCGEDCPRAAKAAPHQRERP